MSAESGLGPHVLGELLELLRGLDPLRLAVSEPDAAAMLAICPRTLSKLPAGEVGRFRIGTSIRYSVERLREFVAARIGV